MPQRLPLVLSEFDLPLAELTAARLDGELFAVDSAFCPIDEIEQPRHRLRALGVGLHERLIAEQLSAAWVWGALATPPQHHQFCAVIDSRVSRSVVAWRTVREVVLTAAEVSHLDGLGVTTPLRTAVDLLRFSDEFGAREHRIVRQLMRIGGFSIAQCMAAMDERRNLPGKRRAASRLSGVDAVDVVHGVDSSHGVEHTVEVGRVAHLEYEPAERKALA